MSCTTVCPKTKIETVEVKVPVETAIDPQLTTAAAEPTLPPRACVDADGAPTICQGDLTSYTLALRTWGRGLAAKLGKIAGLQPKAKP